MFDLMILGPDLALVCKWLGVAGFVVYMASFAALQFDLIDGHGLIYPLCNVAAAALVLVSLTAEWNLASALIQVSWITIGTIGVTLRLRRARQTRRPLGG